MSIMMLVGLSRPAEAKRNPMQNQEESDFSPPPFVDLAQGALVEGDIDAAVRVLKSAQGCWAEHHEKCGFTKIDYDSLSGVVYLEHGLDKKAVRSLEGVVADQPNRTMAWFYLGQAYLRLSQYRKAAKAFTEAASVGKKMPRYHGMLVRAWKGANEDEKARVAFAAGLRRFPSDAALLYEGTTLYLSKGLFLAARNLARLHAVAAKKNADMAFLMVAESYRKKGWLREAIATLEEARLLCDDGSQAAIRLAYVYAEDGQLLSAARLFERFSSTEPSLLHAASEQYRLAGHILEAQRLAMKMKDDTKRRMELAVISLQVEGFDTVVQLLEPIFKSGELGSKGTSLGDQGTFRLAYAALRSGRLDLAEKLLVRLRKVQLGESVEKLRHAFSRCKLQPWECW